MFAIRNIRDAQCSSMFSMREVGMLDVREVGCWRCWVLGMYVRDVGYGTFAAMLDAGLQNVSRTVLSLLL